ncbi:hypothetical protein [uncultured Nostoc sp.]|uniref:hypothetical protein n=1 Tax=uncultured Nostoc sp. TaxID=340711 RepID=UPI0035C9F397
MRHIFECANFENRQIEACVALAKLNEIANECTEAEVLRQRLKVDENTFAIYTVIKQAVDRLDINQAETINAIYGNFPDYWWDAPQEIDLRIEVAFEVVETSKSFSSELSYCFKLALQIYSIHFSLEINIQG